MVPDSQPAKSSIMKKKIPISIGGVVIAAAWTPLGDVTEVDIAGYDERRYRVVDDHIGGQLRDYIKKRVVVEGVVNDRKDGLAITVKRFRVDNPNTLKVKAPENTTSSVRPRQ